MGGGEPVGGPGIERRGKGGWDDVLDTEAGMVAPGAEWRSELYRIAVEHRHAALDHPDGLHQLHSLMSTK